MASYEKFKVTIVSCGKTKTVEAAPDESLLEVALKADMDPPYSCLEGICGTCEARVEIGESSLSYETESKAPNLVVKTCMTRPKSDMKLNYDKV